MTPKTITSRLRRREGGFTLVELMVVVMIIAILMAIAIPTFLNSRKRAQDSAAKSNSRTALSAAQSVYSENQSYIAATFMADLVAEEPSLEFVASTVASSAPKEISVKFVDADTIYMAAKSASGKCFALRHSVASGATGGTSEAKLTTCTGDEAAAATTVYTAL